MLVAPWRQSTLADREPGRGEARLNRARGSKEASPEKAGQRDHDHFGDQVGGLHPGDLVAGGAPRPAWISASEAETIWMSRIAMNMPKTIAMKAKIRRIGMASAAGVAAAGMAVVAVAMPASSTGYRCLVEGNRAPGPRSAVRRGALWPRRGD
jgi:hypothetical protein